MGETYDLSEEITLTDTVTEPEPPRYLRLEIIERMNTLKEELEDMEAIVKEDYLGSEVNDSEIISLKGKLKELENQIVKIVENK